MRVSTLAAFALLVSLVPPPAAAQVSERARPLPVVSDGYSQPVATQIGRRLFVGGGFERVSPPTGGAVVTDVFGKYLPGRFPRVDGTVDQIIEDGAGGWILVGAFTHVEGQPLARVARVTAQRHADPTFRVVVDARVRHVALAHGHLYLAGDFTTVNGARRDGLAALDARSLSVAAWGAGFARGGRTFRALTTSSTGVYASGYRPYYGLQGSRVWGLDAGDGRLLFQRDEWASDLAATSSLVYLAQYGYQRPIVALDARTGGDTTWAPDLRFSYLSGTYGDYTTISNLLVDGTRLYFAGYFQASGARSHVAAVDAATGAAIDWVPSGAKYPTGTGELGSRLVRAGPAVVLTSAGGAQAFGVATGGPRAFAPQVFGNAMTVVPAPEGAVVGGDFNGAGATTRPGLAAIDLDTGTLEPWAPVFSGTAFFPITGMATDGTSLFVQRAGVSRYAKIDPVSGATLGDVQLSQSGDYVKCRMRVAGAEVVVCPQAGGPSELGVFRIADWSYQRLPVTLSAGAVVSSIEVLGNTIYLAGSFTAVNGTPRAGLAAVDRATGAVLPFRADVTGSVTGLRAAGGRLYIAGGSMRFGATRRRGLAAVDAITGALSPWNPDAAGLWADSFSALEGVDRIEVDLDGTVYASLGGPLAALLGAQNVARPTVAGRETGSLVAFSAATGARLPWRPSSRSLIALLDDCLLAVDGCLSPAPPPPSSLAVQRAGSQVTISWSLPPAAMARTAVRLEVAAREEGPPLASIDLPATQTSITAPVPPGAYAVRARSLAGSVAGPPSSDATFSIGPPDVPGAPREARATTEGRRVTMTWQPPSTGAPPAYVLEAGTAEGRRDLGGLTIDGASTSLTFDVPLGIYWTRLSAANANGRSAPGGEVLIDVVARQDCGLQPIAPIGLTATVSGRTVSLAWQFPGGGPNVDGLFLEVGSQAGGTEFGRFQLDLGATTFSTPAPPGVYYLRVATDNLCGVSAAGNEVRVVVP